MSISLRLNNDDEKLIKKYAKLHNISVSELLRQSVLEKIEDELDLKKAKKSISQHKSNPVSYTHEEVVKMLELE